MGCGTLWKMGLRPSRVWFGAEASERGGCSCLPQAPHISHFYKVEGFISLTYEMKDFFSLSYEYEGLSPSFTRMKVSLPKDNRQDSLHLHCLKKILF